MRSTPLMTALFATVAGALATGWYLAPGSVHADDADRRVEELERAVRELREEASRHRAEMGRELARDEVFVKAMVNELVRGGLVRRLADELPKERVFITALAQNRDLQGALAANLAQDHLAPFVTALLRDDAFQKGVESHLTRTDRYLKASAQALAKQQDLQSGLSAERRFVAALAQALARAEHLDVLTDQLVRSDRFLRAVVDSSTFTSQLTRSDRVVNGLTDNSSFISKLKSRLAR